MLSNATHLLTHKSYNNTHPPPPNKVAQVSTEGTLLAVSVSYFGRAGR